MSLLEHRDIREGNIESIEVIGNYDKNEFNNIKVKAEILGCNLTSKRQMMIIRAGSDMKIYATDVIVLAQDITYLCRENHIKKLVFKGVDSSKVINMRHMFEHVGYIDELDLTSFDFSNARFTNEMFKWVKIGKLDLSKADFSSVVCANEMFSLATIGELDLSNVDLPKLESAHYLFYRATINKLILGFKDFKKLIQAAGMFRECKIQEIEVEGMRFRGETLRGNNMFLGSEIGSIDFSKVEINNLENARGFLERAKINNKQPLQLNISFYDGRELRLGSFDAMFKGFETSKLTINFLSSRSLHTFGSKILKDCEADVIDISSLSYDMVHEQILDEMFAECKSKQIILNKKALSLLQEQIEMVYNGEVVGV